MKHTSRSPARLSRSISFRLNDADFTRVAYQAAVLNLRVNELARMRTLGSEQQPIILQTHRTYDPSLITQLIAIGNNLNQMVKRFHVTDHVSPYLEALCRKIERIIDAAIQDEGDV